MIETKESRDSKIEYIFNEVRKSGCKIDGPQPLQRKLGDNATCFTATYQGKKVFVKSNPNWHQHAADVHGIKALEKAGIPGPRVIFHNGFDTDEKPLFIVQTFLEGHPLADEPVENQGKLWREAGSLLKKIHKIPVTGYGKWDYSKIGLVGEKQTWAEGMRNPELQKLKDLGEINAEEYDFIKQIFENLRKRTLESPVFIYNDFHPDHILIQDGKIVGVIDPGNSRSGDYLYDLAYTCHYLTPENKKAFLDGYGGEIDKDLLMQYELIIAARKVYYRKTAGKREALEESRKMLKKLITELQKI